MPPAAGGLFLKMVKGVEFIKGGGEGVYDVFTSFNGHLPTFLGRGGGGGHKNILVVKLGGYLPNFLEVLSRQKNRTLVSLIVSVFSGFVSTN